MEIAVLYNSNTGFTRKYARLIADSMPCDIIELKDAAAETLAKYPLIVFGGWVCGGVIQGLEEARKLARGRIMIFAVGALPADGSVAAELVEKNSIEKEPFYYFEGGIRTTRQSAGQKKALEIYKNSLKQVDYSRLTDKEKFFLNNIGRSFDHSSPDAAEELIKRLRILKNTRPDSSTWFEL